MGLTIEQVSKLLSNLPQETELITGKSDEENQTIGQKVSWCMTHIIKKLKVKPRFLITKEGITSSDLATKALGVKKALVKGQIQLRTPLGLPRNTLSQHYASPPLLHLL